jgi:hypothetical protein
MRFARITLILKISPPKEPRCPRLMNTVHHRRTMRLVNMHKNLITRRENI